MTMASDHRPSLRRVDSSPSRGPRPGSEWQNNSHFTSNKVYPRDSRDRDRDRGRGRDRDRSRSPPYRSPEHYRDNSNRLERRNSNYPPKHDKYCPDNDSEYSPPSAARQPIEPRRSSSVQNSASQSPFRLPDRLPPTDTLKKDKLSETTGPRSESHSSMKEAPSVPTRKITQSGVQEVSVDRQDKASSAQDPTMDLGIDHAETTKSLSSLFEGLAETAADMSFLNAQKISATKKLEKRRAEFDKSTAFHKKFPSIEESQSLAKASAQKVYNSISIKLSAKDSLLKKRAQDAAEQVIPTIIAQARDSGHRGDKQRLDAIEQRFIKLLEDQKNFQEQFGREKKSYEEQLEKERQLYQNQKEQALNQFDQRLKDQAELARTQRQEDIKNLQTQMEDKIQSAIEALKKDWASKAKQSDDLVNDRLANLHKNVGDHIVKIDTLTKLSEKVQEHEVKIGDHASKIGTLNDRTSDLGTLKSRILKELSPDLNKFTKEQKAYDTKLGTLESRFRTMEARPNFSTIDGRVRCLEENLGALNPSDIATKKDLDAVKDRVKKVETPSPIATPTIPNTQLKLQPSQFESRVQALEQQIEPLSNQLKNLQVNGIFELKKQDIDNLTSDTHDLEADVRSLQSETRTIASNNAAQAHSSIPNSMSAIEKRITALEASRSKDVSSSAASPLPTQSSDEITSKLTTLESQVQDLEELQNHLLGQISNLINEGVSQAAEGMDSRFKGYDTRLTVAETDISGLKPRYNSLLTDVQETQRNLPAIATNLANQMKDLETRLCNSLVPIQSTVATEKSTVSTAVEDLKQVSHGLENLRARVDNITTNDLARYMIGQLAEMYPHLQNTDKSISEFHNTLGALLPRIIKLEEDANRVQDLPQTDSNQVQELRKNIDQLSKNVVDINRALEDITALAKNADERLKPIEEMGKKNADAIASGLIGLHGLIDTQTEKITSLEGTIGEQGTKMISVDGQIASLKQAMPSLRQASSQPPKASSPAPSHSSKGSVSHSRGNSANFDTPVRSRGARHNRQESINSRNPIPSSRQPSVASDNINKNLKRKLVNGISRSTPNGLSKSPHLEGPHKKARCKDPLADDSADDPDYEDAEIPQPRVESDDEDE